MEIIVRQMLNYSQVMLDFTEIIHSSSVKIHIHNSLLLYRSISFVEIVVVIFTDIKKDKF